MLAEVARARKRDLWSVERVQGLLNYLYIAKGSAGEVRAQLYAGLDAGYFNIETFKHLSELAKECSRLLQSFAEKVKIGSRNGTQFKHVSRPDPVDKFLKQHAPEAHERFHGI